MQEMSARSLSREDPQEEGMATPSSVVAWRIPRTEAPGGTVHGAAVGHDRTHSRTWSRRRKAASRGAPLLAPADPPVTLCVSTVLGKIRSAVGSAQLLMSQKFQQFYWLCQQNMVSAPSRP